MRVFLFVIDGLGMWSEGQPSTYQILKDQITTRETEFPVLMELGFEMARNGKGNLLRQRSCGVGSLEGHREMLGCVSESEYVTLPNGIPQTILNRVERKYDFRCIGNIQGRGKTIIPDFWKRHQLDCAPIIYTGFDYTISIAFGRGLLDIAKVQSFGKSLLIELQYAGYPTRKFIVREFDGSPDLKVSEIEVFLPRNFDWIISRLGFDSLFVNNKIQDIFNFETAQIWHTQSDAECFDCFREFVRKSNSGLCFLNLGDFDLYAHKGDKDRCMLVLEQIDAFLLEVRRKMTDSDYLIVTSDHGVRYGNSDLSFSHLLECTLLLVSSKATVYYHDGIADGHGFVLEILNCIAAGKDLKCLDFTNIGKQHYYSEIKGDHE